MAVCKAIQPASRPITSIIITLWWLSAVVTNLSKLSVAICTAVLKPKVKSVEDTSLSMVLGTPTIFNPFSKSFCEIRCEPSPPILITASTPIPLIFSINSSDLSVVVHVPSGCSTAKSKGLPLLVVFKIVPPFT